jgi:hypothetical protein
LKQTKVVTVANELRISARMIISGVPIAAKNAPMTKPDAPILYIQRLGIFRFKNGTRRPVSSEMIPIKKYIELIKAAS